VPLKKRKSVGYIAQCVMGSLKSMINCKDMGMIYNIPAEDYKPPNSENHEDTGQIR